MGAKLAILKECVIGFGKKLLPHGNFPYFLKIIFHSDFYMTSLQLVLCSVAAVKRLPVHQP